MDPLSDVLRVISLDGGVFLDAQFTAPWSVLSHVKPADLRYALPNSAHVMAYHYVYEGRLLLQVQGLEPVPLQQGDVVLLSRNDAHVLSSAPGLACIDAGALVAPARDGRLAQIRFGGGGAPARIVCGFLGLEDARHPLVGALPRILKLSVRESSAGAWIETMFHYAAQESEANRPGCESSLAKVSELLLVEAVRRHLEDAPEQRRGWLAGLADPIVGRALTLLHERPAHAWSVDALAEQVHLSRSAFAERFTAVVGMSPLSYLASWRMQLARRALRQGRSVSQVGALVGYDSDAAFSRAFKREVGMAPTRWRAGVHAA